MRTLIEVSDFVLLHIGLVIKRLLVRVMIGHKILILYKFELIQVGLGILFSLLSRRQYVLVFAPSDPGSIHGRLRFIPLCTCEAKMSSYLNGSYQCQTWKGLCTRDDNRDKKRVS